MTNMRLTGRGRLVAYLIVACLVGTAGYLIDQKVQETLPGCSVMLDDGTVIEVGDCDTYQGRS